MSPHLVFFVDRIQSVIGRTKENMATSAVERFPLGSSDYLMSMQDAQSLVFNTMCVAHSLVLACLL